MKYLILSISCLVLLAVGGCPAPPAPENELRDLLTKIRQVPNTVHDLKTVRITWERDYDLEADSRQLTFLYKHPDKYKLISSGTDGSNRIQVYNGTAGADITGDVTQQLSLEAIVELKLNILKAVINDPTAPYSTGLTLSSRPKSVLQHQCFYLRGSRQLDGVPVEEELFLDATNFLPVRIITKIKFDSGEKLYTNDFFNYHLQDGLVLNGLMVKYDPIKAIFRNIKYEINPEIPDSEFAVPEPK